MDHIPAPAVAGNCANCNHPTDQHDPRCPTRPYQGKHERFPTEPQPASAQMVTLNATDDALAIERPGVEYPWHDRSWVIAQNRSADTGEPIDRPLMPSIFDAPPADREYAKAKARALIAEFEIWVNSPGVVWDDAAAGAWMGQACTILEELAK